MGGGGGATKSQYKMFYKYNLLEPNRALFPVSEHEREVDFAARGSTVFKVWFFTMFFTLAPPWKTIKKTLSRREKLDQKERPWERG